MHFLTQYPTPSRNTYWTQNPVSSGECGFEYHLRHTMKLSGAEVEHTEGHKRVRVPPFRRPGPLQAA